MATFALVAEGITDQVVIESVVRAHCRAMAIDDVDVVPVQPMRDATDEARAAGHGGWESVLEFCAAPERIQLALSFNDYLVIHLDTDCAGHINYGMDLVEQGLERSAAEVVQDVQAFLITKISRAIFSQFEGRISFAIAVHSVECWILPMHAKTEIDKRRTHSCEVHLNKVMNKLNKKYCKDYPTYRDLMRKVKKKKDLDQICLFNDSFGIFINNLPPRQ